MRARPVNSRVGHGDPTCADYGCKRPECLQARREKQKRNKYLLNTGRPGHVPADRAAAHLLKFRAAGLQDLEILQTVGIAKNTFYRIVRGEPLTRKVEQRILAVPAPARREVNSNTATVDAIGTHRRLHALMALGWPTRVLTQHAGVHPQWTSYVLRRSRVWLATESRVRKLYDDLWSRSPLAAGVPAEDVEAARAYAQSRGWHGPLAWDDDTIDDPTAVPQTDALEPAPTQGVNVADRFLMGESVVLDRAARLEVLTHLMEWTNDTTEEIAARLEMSPDAAEQAWNRIKRRAKERGGKVPWRRVYVPRRELNRHEMESAA